MKAKYLSIVYVSTATIPFTQMHLMDLLEKVRKKNQALGVTGMLLHDDGNFMQVVEGPHEKVRNLYEKILHDHRHSGVLTLMEQEIDEREFENWSMAFRDASSLLEEEREGLSKLLNKGEVPKEFISDPSRAKKLLLSFRNNLRNSY